MRHIYKNKFILSFLCFSLLLGISGRLSAQVSAYTFSQSVGTYTPIAGGTLLTTTVNSDDEYFVDPAALAGGTTVSGPGFPIGFNFTYNGVVFDKVGIQYNGWISLGQSSVTPSVNMTSTPNPYTLPLASGAVTPAQLRNRISAMGGDLQGQTGSEIRLLTIGTTPNRVFVVQYTGLRKFGAAGDNLTFQIRLNETSNIVNIVFGTNTFGTGTGTVQAGLGGSVSTDFNDRTTTTDWNATTAGAANNSTLSQAGATVPVSGRTYTWSTPSGCTGTPNPGNTVGPTGACSGVSFTLSTSNPINASGLTYQWQSAASAGGPWNNIAGATSATYTTTQTVATYYRINVTCAGATGTSTPLFVPMNGPTSCYCAAGATNTGFEKITNVVFNTISNPSTSTAGYEDFTAISTTVSRNSTYNLSVTYGTPSYATDQVIVFIDYNQNGSFTDPGETVYTSTPGVGPATGTITIPVTALTGTTRMRIRMHDSGSGANATSCGNSTYGQVEDYTLNITSCQAGSVSTQPANSTITCGSNATFTVGTSGTGVTVQWQESTNGGTTFTNLANGGVYSGVTTNTLTITGAPITLNGYQYRAVLSGTCTPPNTTSNNATLTINQPAAPTVSPTNPVSCANGAPVPISITTVGALTTTTFSSGPISVVVTDNTVVGATHTIPVSGIPAGSIISSMVVAVNMTHTYNGDEVLALKAPNGEVLNLDYYISATGGGPSYPTVGFVNTRFSSASVTNIGSSTDYLRYNGIFKADGYIIGPAVTGYPINATGPTGYAATVATFPGLYSTPNGNWTLAMYDGGPGDVGTLTSWSVTITYGPGAAGTWSPTTGLFTDAAGTVPYTGTPVNTVYAKPAASTSYSVTITQGGCTSAATTVPVTVNTPVSITQPVAASVCAGSNTSFSITATGTAPITYQWQVSTDNGATWSNIAGATSNTYVITAATISMNGYKYRVVVTGAAPCGSVTSNAVNLTVNPLPRLTIAANRTKLIPTTTATITATITPSGNGTYKWYLNGVLVPGSTTGSIVVDIDHIGDYSAIVTDANGCVSALSNILTISDTASGQLFLYPNPNNGIFHVRFYTPFYDPNFLPPPGVNAIEIRYISVYDMVGQRILDKPFSVYAPYGSMNVDLRPWGKGTYLIMVKDVQGRKLASGRAVIQ